MFPKSLIANRLDEETRAKMEVSFLDQSQLIFFQIYFQLAQFYFQRQNWEMPSFRETGRI